MSLKNNYFHVRQREKERMKIHICFLEAFQLRTIIWFLRLETQNDESEIQ